METIEYADIDNKLGLLITRDFPGATAQTATNYGLIVTPPFPFEVLSVSVRHTVNGTSPTLDVYKVPNGTAIASGASILSSTFSLSSGANTTQYKNGIDLKTNRSFDPKDSIALVLAGTAGALEGVQVSIYLKPLRRGAFR